MDSFWAIVFGLLSLTVHELGHYEAMRRCGVKVKEVSLLGFPISFLPSWYWQVNGVVWGVHPFLLGAYVEPSSEEEIHSKSLWDQLYIYGSGPIANVIYAMVLTSIVGIIDGLRSGNLGKIFITFFVFGGGAVLVWMARRRIALVLPIFMIPIILLVGYSLFSISPSKVIEGGGGGPVAALAALIGATDIIDALKQAAFLSINLAVINLLPVSVLDGGRILGAILKTWFGVRYENIYQWITTPLLIALIVYSLGLDVVRIWRWM